jgi:uncharacterized phiE125 gp8 family phage protein
MYRVIVPTEEELISVEEFKQFVRVDLDETVDDALMKMILESSIEFCESYTGRSIALKTYEKVYKMLCHSHVIEVRKGDITELISLKKKDSSGNELEYDIDDFEYYNYPQESEVNTKTDGTLIEMGTSSTRPLVLTFKSGYTNTTLPKNLKNGILMIASHWYENRETIKIEEMTDVTQMPYGATTVLERYKYRRL